MLKKKLPTTRKKTRKKIRKSREKPDAFYKMKYWNRGVVALWQGQGDMTTVLVSLWRELSRTLVEPPTFRYFVRAAME